MDLPRLARVLRMLLFVSLPWVAGCASGPAWRYSRIGTRATLLGVRQIVFEPLHTTDVRVETAFMDSWRPEAEWLAGRSPRQRRLWGEDKAAMARAFSTAVMQHLGEHGIALASRRAPQDPVVRIEVSWMYLGYDWVIFHRPATIHVFLQVRKEGRIDEEISFYASGGDGLTIRQRVASAAAAAGEVAARYLLGRVTL